MVTISTLVDELDGQAVVVKAASGASVDRLVREAERLRRASHPGVVEVIASGPSAQGWELVTAHAGRSLETGPPGVGGLAHLCASLAATVADLHDLGVVHGRIDRSHVLRGEDGRAILCGFGPGSDGPPPTPSDDVAAIGHLLTALLGSAPVAEVFPERRWALRRSQADAHRRALLVLADHACAEPSTLRPTARRLAAALSDLAPCSERAMVDQELAPTEPSTSARGPGALDASTGPPTGAAEHRGLTVGRAGLFGGVGLALLLAAGLRSATSEQSMAVDQTSPGSATAPVIEVEGRVVSVDGQAYEVGDPGDEVVVGDWDCDGTPTPAVLRPRSGEVFTFDTWGTGSEVVVGPAGHVPGAARLVVRQSEQCAELWVETAAGDLKAFAVRSST